MWQAPLSAGAKVTPSKEVQTCLKPVPLSPIHRITEEYQASRACSGELGLSSGHAPSLCIEKFRISAWEHYFLWYLPAGEPTSGRYVKW